LGGSGGGVDRSFGLSSESFVWRLSSAVVFTGSATSGFFNLTSHAVHSTVYRPTVLHTDGIRYNYHCYYYIRLTALFPGQPG